jgi:hypothetical protein
MTNRELLAENKRLRHALADAARIAGEYAHWARGEIDRLERIEKAASHYRFAGADGCGTFLESRGWVRIEPGGNVDPGKAGGWWKAPEGYPVKEPKSLIVSLAVELEMSMGLHK